MGILAYMKDRRNEIEMELARSVIRGIVEGRTVFAIPERLWSYTLADELRIFAEVNGNCAIAVMPTEADKHVYLYMHPAKPNGAAGCVPSDHSNPDIDIVKEATLNRELAQGFGIA